MLYIFYVLVIALLILAPEEKPSPSISQQGPSIR